MAAGLVIDLDRKSKGFKNGYYLMIASAATRNAFRLRILKVGLEAEKGERGSCAIVRISRGGDRRGWISWERRGMALIRSEKLRYRNWNVSGSESEIPWRRLRLDDFYLFAVDNFLCSSYF